MLMMIFMNPIPIRLMQQSMRKIKHNILYKEKECKLPNNLNQRRPSL
jgi:hypothetical protein